EPERDSGVARHEGRGVTGIPGGGDSARQGGVEVVARDVVVDGSEGTDEPAVPAAEVRDPVARDPWEQPREVETASRPGPDGVAGVLVAAPPELAGGGPEGLGPVLVVAAVVDGAGRA